jgi:hypothetical protein
LRGAGGDPSCPLDASSALLSVEDSLSRARPLRAWKTSDRARVEKAVSAVWRAWRDAWGLSGEAGEILSCAVWDQARAGALLHSDWQPLGNGGSLWWRAGASSLGGWANAASMLARALVGEALSLDPFDGSTASGVGVDLVRAAWADLAARLAGLGPKGPSVEVSRKPCGTVFAPWSGALLVTIPWWGVELRLLLGRDAVDPLVDPRPREAAHGGLVPVWRALAGRSARIEVVADPFELDLGTLASLRAGDVVRTAHRLDRPLDVLAGSARGESLAAVCSAFLGSVGASRAVELAARHPPSPKPGRPGGEH